MTERDPGIKEFLDTAKILFSVPTPEKLKTLVVPELPFDLQLLNASSVYRDSREMYLQLGGRFFPRVCSTMRGLSTQDLFQDAIDYSPTLSEVVWFNERGHIYSDAAEEITALIRFSEISIFHEQNHRILWRLLPNCPESKDEVCRYLDFAESLVVTLDMALGDQLGRKVSTAFEKMKVIYHPGGFDSYSKKSKAEYRQYLLAIFTTTYFAMQTMHNDDVLNAVNYVLPGQKRMNQVAVNRALQLSELFTRVTNPEWQSLNWESGRNKLKKLRAGFRKQNKTKTHYLSETLALPTDPLDLQNELDIVLHIFDYFGL